MQKILILGIILVKILLCPADELVCILITPKGEQKLLSELIWQAEGGLYDIRKSLRAGKVLACATATHALSIHDVKLYNGRWFILVKDPHNINSFEYTKDQNGALRSDGSLMDKTQKVRQNSRVRKLDGTMLSAVLGISWWELNDFSGNIASYVACP